MLKTHRWHVTEDLGCVRFDYPLIPPIHSLSTNQGCGQMKDSSLANQGPYTFTLQNFCNTCEISSQSNFVNYSLDQSHQGLQPLVSSGDWVQPMRLKDILSSFWQAFRDGMHCWRRRRMC